MWAAIGAALSFIWGGIEAGLAAIVQFLVWAYNLLIAMVLAAGNALLALGRVVEAGLKDVWAFSQWTYDNVLKPAWTKFWNLVDRLKTTLDKLFAPVFKFLRTVRDEIIKLYAHFVRPVLDIIDATRVVLDGLKALHIEWAAALDNWLQDLETKINEPFQFVLSQINGLIDWVNKIATFDGLLQRLALVRSLERDAAYWISTFWKHTVGDVPARSADAAAAAGEPLNPPDYYGQQLAAFYESGGGDFADEINALAPLWQQALELPVSASS